MSEKSKEQIAAEFRARRDLEQIDRLLNFPPFTYFLRRLDQKIDAIKEQILDPQTPDDETSLLKKILRALQEIRTMPEQDAIGCRRILGID